MRDPDKIKAFQKVKNDEYARTRGFKDFEDLYNNSKFGEKVKTNKYEQN